MAIVGLKMCQGRSAKFNHPLLKGARPYTAEEFAPMVEAKLAGGPPEELILALRSVVRYTVGRYLYYWPVTRKFKDDMVSEGLVAVTIAINTLSRHTLSDRPIMKMVSLRVRNRIEEYVNKARGILSVHMDTQYRHQLAGHDPIHGQVVSSEVEKEDPENLVNCYDILDAVNALRTECEVVTVLLDPRNWGCSNVELATMLGVDEATVRRRRVDLYHRYRTLTEGDQ